MNPHQIPPLLLQQQLAAVAAGTVMATSRNFQFRPTNQMNPGLLIPPTAVGNFGRLPLNSSATLPHFRQNQQLFHPRMSTKGGNFKRGRDRQEDDALNRKRSRNLNATSAPSTANEKKG